MPHASRILTTSHVETPETMNEPFQGNLPPNFGPALRDLVDMIPESGTLAIARVHRVPEGGPLEVVMFGRKRGRPELVVFQAVITDGTVETPETMDDPDDLYGTWIGMMWQTLLGLGT